MATSKGKFAHVVRVDGKRSRYEFDVAGFLDTSGVEYDFEKHKIPYFDNGRLRNYTPDFILASGIILECKGWFQPQDRTKTLLVREQYPMFDLRFVFQRANNKLNKTSATTYAMWCEKNGFKWADKLPPAAWLT